ncbi:putative AP-4 complex accessory subunit Tepsin [Plasmopara halstedii]
MSSFHFGIIRLTDEHLEMEEAMHFLDELKDKYLHQVEQAIEDWDYQDFSPDKRFALLDNDGEQNARDGQSDCHTLPTFSNAMRKSWVGLTPDAELENFACDRDGTKGCDYEMKLVVLCTPPGGINGIPSAESVQRLLAQIPRVDAVSMAAAFAARLQDIQVSQPWQVRAKAILLMQILVEIKPFAGRYIPVFEANSKLLSHLDSLRTSSQNQVVREGARKLLSLIRSNGTNSALIPKSSPVKPHVRHVQIVGGQNKIRAPVAASQPSKPRMSPGKLAVDKIFKPELVVSTDNIQSSKSSLVLSPKVSQAVQASWRRRTSESKLNYEGDNIMQNGVSKPLIDEVPIGVACQSSVHKLNVTLDSGRPSAFSFVQ